MHAKALLAFTLVGGSAAQTINSQTLGYQRLHPRELTPRDVQTLVTIKSSLKNGAAKVTAVDNALKKVTKSNAKEALGAVNQALQTLATEVSSDTRKMKSSGSIGIGEILGLLQEGPRNELLKPIGDLFTALNSTAVDLLNLRDTIKDTKTADIIAPGLKAQSKGLADILSIVPSQVPSIAKGAIDGIIGSLMSKMNAPKEGGEGGAAAMASPPADSAPKGKGGKGAPKGGAKGGGSSSGVTLEKLLASSEAQENIKKGIDGAMDRLISWLKGDTEDLLPPELLAGLGNLAGSLPKGPPGGAPKGAAPPPGGDDSPASPAPKGGAPKGGAPKGGAPKGGAPKDSGSSSSDSPPADSPPADSPSPSSDSSPSPSSDAPPSESSSDSPSPKGKGGPPKGAGKGAPKGKGKGGKSPKSPKSAKSSWIWEE